MKPISICQFIDALSDASGGGSVFSRDLCTELNKIGARALIISRQWKNESDRSFCGPHVVKVSPPINSFQEQKHGLGNYLNFEIQNARLVALFRKYDKEADVFQIHGETVPLLPHIATPKLLTVQPWTIVKKPVCLTVHALWSLFNSEKYVRTSEKRMFERADHIVVVERFMKRILERVFSIDRRRITYLPSGIRFGEKPSEANIELSHTPKIVFTAMRLSPERDPDTIIRAASALKRTRDDHVFLIAGGGPRMECLRKLAGNLGISDKVIFLGPISRDSVLSIMRRCSVVINPTRLPGASKVTLEAFANGKPVIRADAFDTYPVVDNVSGLVYGPTDPDDLAAKINLLLNNEDLARKLGNKGFSLVRDEYDVRRITREYVKIYEQLRQNSCEVCC